MRGFATSLLLIIGIIAVIGMVAYIVLAKSHTSSDNVTASAPVTAIVSTKDFAPGLPMSQKTTILIQTNDSSEIKYIVPTSQVDTYSKSLPEGYRVVSKTP